jgi:hypothetical protein
MKGMRRKGRKQKGRKKREVKSEDMVRRVPDFANTTALATLVEVILSRRCEAEVLGGWVNVLLL